MLVSNAGPSPDSAKSMAGLSLARPLRPSDLHIDRRISSFVEAFESNDPILHWPRAAEQEAMSPRPAERDRIFFIAVSLVLNATNTSFAWGRSPPKIANWLMTPAEY
jgi:hypothetical protein